MVFCLVVGGFSANAQTTLFQMGLEATTDGSTVSNEFAVGTATTPTYLYLNIHLDAEESGVAACAFTLNYDPTYLEAPATNTDGLPTAADGITSVFPFTTTVGTETTKTHRVILLHLEKFFSAVLKLHLRAVQRHICGMCLFLL